MRDFDLDRDERQALGRTREFKLCGQTFTARLDVRPEAITNYLSAGSVTNEFLAAADALFRAFLPDESYHRFAELRARDDQPLTIRDISGIAAWLIEEETARPTSASSGSTPGRATSGTTSTDASSSQDKTPTGSLTAVV